MLLHWIHEALVARILSEELLDDSPNCTVPRILPGAVLRDPNMVRIYGFYGLQVFREIES